MALVQHNIKKLLGYHAVSQVGYMILGIGTANPIGIAGGLFHMLNHAVYKSCLFFSAGSVEYRAKSTEVDQLGGLAKFMPITYAVSLIASLSISGVPPFNGFFSKWMIYQGLIQRLSFGKFSALTVFCLVAAMFGSALTLASFIKLIYSVYLRKFDSSVGIETVREVPKTMWIPSVFLAAVCIIFGIFAYQLPLKYLILPLLDGVYFTGIWFAGTSTLLILAGLLLGIIIFRLKSVKPLMREDSAFVGGEELYSNDYAISGAQFYNTVKEIKVLSFIYNYAEKGIFDIYEQFKRVLQAGSVFLKYLHNGVLPSYLTWILLGMAVLLVICCL
jgi:formate hydrogenlyase subunit 3/multisubunit Na+/H+ antiporter MnhD subunit